MFRHTKITDLIEQGDFLLSVELFPPRNGKSPQAIFDKLERLKELDIDFVSITKGAGGSHRGGTIPIGFMIGDRFGIEPLVHFRCRDLTKHAVENELVDHIYFDIKNILAILGDSADSQSVPQLDPEHYNLYASHLVGQIDKMRKGIYLPLQGNNEARKGIETDFCIGVAAYPDAEDIEKELNVFKEKAKAGADFAITQMVFDINSYEKYVKSVRDMGITIPIIPGIRPITTRKHLAAARDVFKTKLTPELEDMLENDNAEDGEMKEKWIDITLKMCRELKDLGAPGIHLFILNDVDIAEKVVKGIRQKLSM